MKPEDQMFMDMLTNREQVILAVLKDLDSCAQNMEAFQKLIALQERGDPVSQDKAMKAFAKALWATNALNRRVLVLLLVYVSGGNFTSDTVSVMAKMGRGEEALKEAFRQKMQGK